MKAILLSEHTKQYGQPSDCTQHTIDNLGDIFKEMLALEFDMWFPDLDVIPDGFPHLLGSYNFYALKVFKWGPVAVVTVPCHESPVCISFNTYAVVSPGAITWSADLIESLPTRDPGVMGLAAIKVGYIAQ